jgi:hypothetical protein
MRIATNRGIMASVHMDQTDIRSTESTGQVKAGVDLTSFEVAPCELTLQAFPSLAICMRGNNTANAVRAVNLLMSVEDARKLAHVWGPST